MWQCACISLSYCLLWWLVENQIMFFGGMKYDSCEWRQGCLPRYLQSSQRGWPWPWPWWGGSILDRPRTDAGTEPSDPLPLGASAPCQKRTQPAVFLSPPEACGQIEWLGKETDGQKHTWVHRDSHRHKRVARFPHAQNTKGPTLWEVYFTSVFQQ